MGGQPLANGQQNAQPKNNYGQLALAIAEKILKQLQKPISCFSLVGDATFFLPISLTGGSI